jgi:translation initiation factor 2 subunit 3
VKEGKEVRYVSFVDAPGHEMLMATMLSGAAMIDAAILVIAANEGIKPQTREHLMALQAKNVRDIIIVQNKIDLVEKHEALRNYEEIKKFIKGTVAEKAPILPVSAQQGVNIDQVLEELVKIKILKRDVESEPVFVVARSFDINKPGTSVDELKGGVLGGCLRKGKLKMGEEIEIKPGLMVKKENKINYQTVRTKILGIFKGKYKVNEALPGGSLALETELDPVLAKADNLSGCVAGRVGKIPEISSKLKMQFNLFKEVYGLGRHQEVEDIKSQELLLLSVNTSITIGTVIKLRGKEAELNLRIPVVGFKGDNVGIARNIEGHWRLIGWGEIIGE